MHPEREHEPELPTTLDQLFRYVANDDGSTTATWNVAAGTLEKEERLYRIQYEDAEQAFSLEQEATIHVQREFTHDLRAFLILMLEIYESNLDDQFRHACARLCAEDPWLRYMILKTVDRQSTAPIRILQSACRMIDAVF